MTPPSNLALTRSLLARTTTPGLRLRLRPHLGCRPRPGAQAQFQAQRPESTLHRPASATTAATARLPRRRPLSLVGMGLGLGLVTAGVGVHAQRPMQFDSVAVNQTQTRSLSGGGGGERPKRKDLLDAETVKQLSGGSLSGFLAGLLVSVFSKTLVLLAGVGMVVIQLAARNGIDLVSTLKLKERASSSRILAALNQHTAFKLSFAIAFALSAFMSF